MQEYDVIVVGAGPAGLNCAKTLSKTNLKVLLLEQNAEIGPKICAGGLTRSCYQYLLNQGLPVELFGKQLNSFTLHTPLNQTTVTDSTPIVCTIDRKDLGQWQLSQLQNTNIEVKTSTRVSQIDLKTKTITINNNEIVKYKYLVGADGATSIVNKAVGIGQKKIAVGIQYLIPSEPRFNSLELFYNDKFFKMHYAWIFPHKDMVSIGCGGSLEAIPYPTLVKNFHSWLKQQKIVIKDAKLQSFPFNFRYNGFQFGDVFLCGEAAGLISSFTGEGIRQALISGEEIAKKMLDNNYALPKLQQLIHQQERHNQIEKFFEHSGYFRKLEFEIVALLLKNNSIKQKLLTRI